MKTKLELQVLHEIQSARLLVPGDRVAVGVSGGADSLALLRLLLSLRESLGVTLLVLHFDHCLRGAESDADARFVQGLAREHQLEFVCDRADVAAIAKEHGLNLEDAARRLRYGFFQRAVAEGRATRVAVAHTADDQAETLLARLLRGTGPRGLAGIYPVLGPVVRPLLKHRRAQLREYLRTLGQSWRDDASNEDMGRQRAQIRAQLLPVLETDFSPAIVGHLGELARLLREEHEFWEGLVEERFSALVHEADGRLRIAIRELLAPLALGFPPGGTAALASLPTAPPPAVERAVGGPALKERALTERLIRRLYQGIRGDCRDLGAIHVRRVLELATAGASGQRVELPDGVLAGRNFGELIFSARALPGTPARFGETKAVAAAYHYTVTLPSRGTASICIPELGTRLLLKVIDWPSLERDTRRDDALDADLLPTSLILRNWQPGDAYRPRGHRQPRKLKEMFLSRRIPRAERSSWPVMECGGRIVWARGMPSAHEFCVRAQTRTGVVIEETRV